mgnify:CR=1 FL=1|jgi:hypothetical protein
MHEEQQMPTEGVQDITPRIIDDLKERNRIGIDRYKVPLRTFNGRDAFRDAKEEILDFVQYFYQIYLEHKSISSCADGEKPHEWVTRVKFYRTKNEKSYFKAVKSYDMPDPAGYTWMVTETVPEEEVFCVNCGQKFDLK